MKYTLCTVCHRTVSMSSKHTIYAHGTRTDRCPGTGMKVGALQRALDEIAAMKKGAK